MVCIMTELGRMEGSTYFHMTELGITGGCMNTTLFNKYEKQVFHLFTFFFLHTLPSLLSTTLSPLYTSSYNASFPFPPPLAAVPAVHSLAFCA